MQFLDIIYIIAATVALVGIVGGRVRLARCRGLSVFGFAANGKSYNPGREFSVSDIMRTGTRVFFSSMGCLRKTPRSKLTRIFIFLLYVFKCDIGVAQDYSFWAYGGDTLYWANQFFNTPQQGCEELYYFWEGVGLYHTPDSDWYYSPTHFVCTEDPYTKPGEPGHGSHPQNFGEIWLITVSCIDDETFDFGTKTCRTNTQKGVPDESLVCSSSKNPSSSFGNPVNIATGLKYQNEEDYISPGPDPIQIARTYNGSDNLWRHTYSDSLYFSAGVVVVERADGQQSLYKSVGGGYESTSGSALLVKLASGYQLTNMDNSRYLFDEVGRLISVISISGDVKTIRRELNTLIISDSTGSVVTLTEDPSHQLTGLSAPGVKFTYNYSSGIMRSLQVERNGNIKTRQYLYEHPYWTKALTGIIDERGIRYATWQYDMTPRPITSEHAGGAEKKTFSYPDDLTTIVTNELGKSTTYKFQNIHGAKYISAIEGEPTANCPASNSSYTYNDRGQVLSKTDAKGYITTYTYNDRGLEASRTEASGTPLARTTTTTWDPTRFLRTQVVEPDRTTVYSYDDQGRLINTQVTAR